MDEIDRNQDHPPTDPVEEDSSTPPCEINEYDAAREETREEGQMQQEEPEGNEEMYDENCEEEHEGGEEMDEETDQGNREDFAA